MGPLFSMIVMAIAVMLVFSVVAFVFRLFLPGSAAIRCAIGFVIGAGAGGVLALGLLALAIGVGHKLSGSEILTYLTALALSAILGGAVLAWYVAVRTPAR